MDTKILIVEDEYISRTLFAKVMDEAKYDYDQAEDEGSALEKLKKNKYSVILLDLRMPPRGFESGFEIMRKKSKSKLNRETPVIIITGALDEHSIMAKDKPEYCVRKILLKPVENKKIRQAIDDILDEEN